MPLDEDYTATLLQAAHRGSRARVKTNEYRLKRINPEHGKSYVAYKLMELKRGTMSYEDFLEWWKTLEVDPTQLEGTRKDIDGELTTFEQLHKKYGASHNYAQILSRWRMLGVEDKG